MSQNILQYESKVWSTADLLIGAGIKQSDFPKYMMPYFAMIMLESRLVRHYKELLKDFGVDSIDDIENINDFLEEFKDYNIGYNEVVIKQHKTLADICKNDKTFDNDFDTYLKAFDPETKELLGVDRGNTEEKYLDISGLSGQLRKKNILFDTVKKWSEIDLTPFNNSDITTLEEHIKRKWADISAETAGEQYTPDDIIALITEIILSKIEDNGEFLTIYDPTCGGGNLLFGVEDIIQKSYNRPTKTYGEDWSDSLYALAKIESRFRTDSDIRYGNTLTNISFIEKQFDVIVANPPYGVDWKGYKKDIENDTTERFHALPSISDGQFLFTQHILSQLDAKGLSVVVHNGSTLFSGDAGSGESNIRKYFFDNDWVEAIIQMPTDEFFNTGIYTYLWIFNKNKAEERKDKVILINGSDFYEPLKKSKGKKRKEMTPVKRETIIEALTNFEDTDYTKVFDKWHFYFNKQAIMLTNVDEYGKTFESQLPVKKNKEGEEIRAKSIKLNPTKITQVTEDETIELTDFEIKIFDAKKHNSLLAYFNDELKPLIANLDYKEADLKVTTEKISYYFDADKETIIEETKDSKTALGCGKMVIKASYKKATKTKEASIVITIELTPDYEKDYEIIPYAPTEEDNQQNIVDFMAKYITKPFRYIENTIGVEINFNKVFYKPEDLRSLVEITTDLQNLEDDLSNLEKELAI
ncbi:HsdM family class I SAM-dependent methyltransferase [Algibacter lectus]|uniref:site-specific DNA-methyltransferase (adenine-specific) n=1 Tax=Algibacter lectus TaxID=221126 RepID=A0A090VK83_9FLAO|nr:N-6 DNA methylase [Algibacter lectus]GAL63759.1 type I restriction-modification system DNA-methyltransferase subunit M [Algibacter lectus]